MEETLKIDMHVHSSGISMCSRIDCKQIVDEKLRLGYDGAVLTNHCQSWYYPPKEHKNFMERVIEEFECGRRYADEKGFRLYLGLEVTLENPYADWLLYGVTKEFLRQCPCLYRLTQKELFALCEKWGLVLVQAHPFRTGCVLGEPQYMHGIEINCTPMDLEKVGLVEELAKAQGLLITCGTDYHSVENGYFGGMLLPQRCETAEDIARYLRCEKNTFVFRRGEITAYENAKFAEK